MSKTTQCGKCEGKGNLWFYSHMDNGVCYTCKGTGTLVISSAAAADNAKNDAWELTDKMLEAGWQPTRHNRDWAEPTARRLAAALIAAEDKAFSRRMLARLADLPEWREMVIAAGWGLRAEAK